MSNQQYFDALQRALGGQELTRRGELRSFRVRGGVEVRINGLSINLHVNGVPYGPTIDASRTSTTALVDLVRRLLK